MHQCLSMKLLPTSKFYTWLQELAKPKPTKDVWNFHRKLIWGNQEPIWPLTSKILLRQPSSRILSLAMPKEIIDKQKKRPRMSPVWPITTSALSCKASHRILSLAQARMIDPNFCFPEQSEKEISRAARSAEATPRLHQLAQPVYRKPIKFYDNARMEAPIRQIPQTALQAVPTPRILELSKPKPPPCESTMDRSAEWPVTAAAKLAVASPRLAELSQPPNRAPTNLVQFNPDAFIVKESAKNAICTERIKNLAKPITR
ncbi:sperm microtubule associated protein 2-like isoform X5 [Erythrolamprus reginae]|uniref:sperm microtubule associated protein 2-like isoform X5 n=1 Tax=Erythrolamprus reginae TaxID=121349 RepID=UPI00396CC710